MKQQASFFGSAALYFSASALAAAGSFFLLPVMTRYLSPNDFGVVAMFSALLVPLGTIVGLGTKAAITARYFRDERRLATFVTTCLLLALVSALLVAAVAWPLRHSVARITQIPGHWGFLAVFAVTAQFATTVQLALLQARRQALLFSVLQVIQTALNLGLSLLLVVGLGLAWEGRIIGLVGAAVATAGLSLAMLWLNFDLAWPPHPDDAREALAYGMPLVLHGVGGTMISIGDRVLITTMLDIEQTGIYAAGLSIAMTLGLLTMAFNRAYVPWLFAGLREDALGFRRRVVQGVFLYAIIAMGAAATFGLVAPFLVEVLLGERFRTSASVLPYLAFGFAFEGLYLTVANHILYSRRTSRLALVTLIAGLANIVFGIVLIQRSGVVGAAQAFMLTQLVLFGMTWWLSQTVLPMPWWNSPSRTRVK